MSDVSVPRTPGTVYTFYSYKGGVGRSMALANVGALLALAGKRVLLIDWDLEAPGLETYFRGPSTVLGDPAVVPGVVDLLEGHVASTPLNWTECLLRARFIGVELHIISAGRRSADYRSRVQKLDWESMYREHRIGNYVNSLREEWRHVYDFVLIDSRTGFTDIGDICTVLLPDAVVLMFVTSYQNVEGIKAAMARAVAARKKMPVNRNRLHGIPLPARDEVYTEYEKSLEWKGIYARELGYLYEEWLPREVSPADALNKLFIPYVTNWSFGERIPVLESARETQDPTSIGAAYKRLANLLASGLDWYSLETTASIEDLQATQIELQRERARAAKLEEQRAHMRRVTALSVLLALVIIVAMLVHDKPVKTKSGGATVTAAAATAVSTDMFEGRRLLNDGNAEAALRIFEARRDLVMQRLAENPASEDKRELLTDYDRANSFAGDALLAMGRTKDALAAYTIALDTRSELAKDTDDPSSQLELVVRHSDIGNALRAQGEIAAALVSYRKAGAILGRLPDDELVQLETATLRSRIGSVLEDQGKLEDALTSYRAGRENLIRLRSTNPTDDGLRDRISLADIRIGQNLRQQGRLNEAMTAFRAHQGVAEELLRDAPENPRWLRKLWASHSSVAETLRDFGNLADAERTSEAADEIADSLLRRYPSDALYQHDRARRYVGRGALLQDQGRYAEALSSFRSAEAIMRKLAARDPANADWNSSLAVAVSRVGDVSTRLGQYDVAEKALKEAQGIMEAFVAKDTTNLDALSTLSFQFKRLGELELARKRPGAAIQALGRAEDIGIRLIQVAPASAYWRRHLMQIARLRSEALLMGGEVGAATFALKLAKTARERAIVHEGSEVYWQPETSRLDLQMGNVLVAEGKLAEAKTAFRRAEKMLLKLTVLDPKNADWHKDLRMVQQRIAQQLAISNSSPSS